MKAPPVEYHDRAWWTWKAWSPTVSDVTFRIPKGYQTDLASIPRVLRSVINTYELGGVGPPLIHDFIYRLRGEMKGKTIPSLTITRRAADRIFRLAMGQEGVGRTKRTVAWLGVRAFGWIPWPPKKSTWRSATRKALHTLWQTGAAFGVVTLFGWPLITVIPLATGLSFLKSMVGVPIGERVTDVLY